MNQLLENDAINEIEKEYGHTLIAVLRNLYGPGFANDVGNEQTLSGALPEMDERSLALLLQDFEAGRLGSKLNP